jgi:K+/H+ antiporter YhaU regulatory subunit KhtT
MSDLMVQEQRLPGIGWRFETPVGEDQQQSLVIVVEDRGPRHMMVFDEHATEPLLSVRLPQNHAAGIAALLTGARLAVSPAPTQP